VTPHFSLDELTRSDYAVRHNICNDPGPDALAALAFTAEQMEAVRALLGHPIAVSSGYRSPALNAAIGGSMNSQHRDGLAVDFTCDAFGTPFEVCKAIEASAIPFDQLIHEYGRWTHISFSREAPRRQCLTTFRPGRYTPGITQRT
jgi:hypothetical protein